MATYVWRTLRDFFGQLWVIVVMFAVGAVVLVDYSASLAQFVPEQLTSFVSENALLSLAQILASSLLTITTFSLSVLVSNFTAAASGLTPRTRILLRDDRTTKNVLATFIGGTVYSFIVIIFAGTAYYDAYDRIVLFFVTVGIVIAVIVQLIRWISHIQSLGSQQQILDELEARTLDTMRE